MILKDILTDLIDIKQESLRHRNAEKLIDAFGTIDFDDSYDYKKERNAQ